MRTILYICMYSFTALFAELPAYAQTYTFTYKLGADSGYMNATDVVHADEAGRYALSLVRKVFYENLNIKGYVNHKYLYYEWDLENVGMVDTVYYDHHDDSTYIHALRGYKESSYIALEAKPVFSFYTDKKKNIQCYLVNDTIQGFYYLAKHKFTPTNDTATFNGWRCHKWIPQDEKWQHRVAVWISSSVPEDVNPGVFFPEFHGGLVRIQWENGRYNQLLQYATEEQYLFKTVKFKRPARNQGLADPLLFSVDDNYKDSFYSKEVQQ